MLRKIISLIVGIFKVIAFLIIVCVFFVTYFVLGLIKEAQKDVVDVKQIRKKIPVQSSEFFSLDGQKVAKLYVENRYWVPISSIPNSVKICLIASEDERFYIHRGVDFIAVVRSIIDIALNKQVTQGGSTITQQLARILFLSPELSIRRKIREAVLAVELEKSFSKQEIMEMYLNLVYFGEGAYGIEAASRVYFAKSVSQLNIPEAAMIIGLLPAPSVYSPYINYKMARKRQLYVLRRLLELKYISPLEYKKYVEYPIRLKRETLDQNNVLYPYYVNYVVQNFKKITDVDNEYLKTMGLRIYLNLDTRIQQDIQKIVKEEIDKNRKANNVNQAAVVVIENYTGRVLALVGGYEYRISDQFNRAYQAYRQPGSVFKIVVYTAALENGFSPNTVVYDRLYTYGSGTSSYSPVNWDGKYWGRMSLIDSFAFSRNTIAVYLSSQIGIDKVIETAKKMGVKSNLEPYLSTALGSSVLSVLEVATLTSVIANYGYIIQPQFVYKVEDRYGGIMFYHKEKYERVLPYQVAKDMRDLMKAVVDRGTGYNARIEGINCYGKTGTTSDHRDAWYSGFTDDFTCVVWVGNDDYSPLYNVYGATLPVEIWRKSILACYKYYKPQKSKPSFVKIDQQSAQQETKSIENNKIQQTTTNQNENNQNYQTEVTRNNNTQQQAQTTTTVDHNTFPWENTTE
ncbi:MAG: PBP1A family penicillin-binding protein [bacterium]